MTNCLRSLSFHLNFSTKLVVLGNGRSVRLQHGRLTSGSSRTQCSSFLHEFLDGRQSSSFACESSKCLVPVSPTFMALTAVPADQYHDDPILHQLLLKPLSVTTDDIVLRSSSSSSTSCDQLLEQDLQRDVIQYERFPINVLMEPLPAALVNQITTFHRSCLPLTELEKNMILTADVSSTQKSHGSQSQMEGKPSEKQINKIFDILSDTIPNFFIKPQNYRIFHQSLVFHNNIRGVTTHGLPAYIQQMALLRLIGHLRFAYVKMEVLKMTKHHEDGTIRVRWRIRGVSGLRIFLQFWKYRVWQYKKLMETESDWYDGFSTFYVASDGLVHKHVCDKMIPDGDKVTKPSKTNLAAKLALLLGAIPRPSIEDLAAVSFAIGQLQHQPLPSHHTHKNDLP